MYPDQSSPAFQYIFPQPQPVKFWVPNKKIAVEPFPSQVPTKQVKGGVLVMAQRGTLQGLRVVYGNEQFLAGEMVYIKAERQSNAIWSREIYDLGDGVKFIVIPEDEIVLVDRWPPPPEAAP